MTTIQVSKATVVSILPWDIAESKPQVYPGNFFIPKADKGKLSLLAIGESTIYIPLDDARGKLAQTISAMDMAKSIVEDYRKGLIFIESGMEPGIFYVPGAHDEASITKNFSDKLTMARTLQERWFSHLITVAGDEWAKSRQKMFIPSICIAAAYYMGQTPEWTTAVSEQTNVNCKFCTSLIPAAAIICPNCKQILDAARVKELAVG